jgi:hypothetical protein
MSGNIVTVADAVPREGGWYVLYIQHNLLMLVDSSKSISIEYFAENGHVKNTESTGSKSALIRE